MFIFTALPYPILAQKRVSIARSLLSVERCLGAALPPGGDEGNRTLDPLLAGQVLSQLSYTPMKGLLRKRSSKIEQQERMTRAPNSRQIG